MKFFEVSPLRITHQQHSTLTYSSDESIARGAIVSVPVGTKQVPGVVLGEVDKPEFDTRPITHVLSTKSLPGPLLTLHAWMSTYYLSHSVNVWQTMLPSGLLKNRRTSKKPKLDSKRKRTQIVLNKDQQKAIADIWKRPGQTTLLHGVTGSGKTQVYIELAHKALAEGTSVIVLVPEIALTSQLVAEFSHHFEDIILTHSTMTEAQRHSAWLEALNSPTPRVVIGPRSALFSPLARVGLIVIDECHEPAYKQEKNPRYSAIRAASILAREHGARLVLGSATPGIVDYYLASQQPGAITHLPTPARSNSVQPEVQVVDMTNHQLFNRSQFISDELITAISETLARGDQSLLFHNRRGSAPTTLCENCGWSAHCPRCFSPLTLHADQHQLRCHLCNHTERVPTTCPECAHANIVHKGIGTKRVAEEIARLFPDARIARFDGDSDSADTLEKHYQALYDGEISIIIGTQVIAKGLDLPHLRTVGVVQADSGLALPDYQSSERVFQLLAQVVGRVGRNEHASKLIVQSYQPSHPSVQLGISQDFESFYEVALNERQKSFFPPYCYLLKATCSYKTEAHAIRAAKGLAATLRREMTTSEELFGPAPAFYERIRGSYRWQIVIKSTSRARLVELAELIPKTQWQFELDPISLL